MKDTYKNELRELTATFLENVTSVAEAYNQSGGFALRYTIADLLVELDTSDYKPEYGVILPMGSMDVNLMKASIDKRIKGFFIDLQKVIAKVSDPNYQQDDYYFQLENEESYSYKTIETHWHGPNLGDYDFEKVTKTDKVLSFNTSNSKNYFVGKVNVFYKENKIDKVDFLVNEKIVFYITLDSKGSEQGTINDISNIKDINSFFLMIYNC